MQKNTQQLAGMMASHIRHSHGETRPVVPVHGGSLFKPSIRNAMSVDVEDYFQVSAFEERVPRSVWPELESRIEVNVDRLLTLFDTTSVKATFFTLGWIAERYPSMIHRIVAAGHELASHGWEHRRVSAQTPTEFRAEVHRAKSVLEDTGGVPVVGFRAPSYSITRECLWAHDILADEGYRYSSSIAPFSHDHYGIADAPRFAYRVAHGALLEVPVSSLRLGRRNYPCGGGGWFRFYPYALSRMAIRLLNENDHEACVFYIHPWEIDPCQPKLVSLNRKTRFRHYVNLRRTEERLAKLLRDFDWGSMESVFLPRPPGGYARAEESHSRPNSITE